MAPELRQFRTRRGSRGRPRQVDLDRGPGVGVQSGQHRHQPVQREAPETGVADAGSPPAGVRAAQRWRLRRENCGSSLADADRQPLQVERGRLVTAGLPRLFPYSLGKLDPFPPIGVDARRWVPKRGRLSGGIPAAIRRCGFGPGHDWSLLVRTVSRSWYTLSLTVDVYEVDSSGDPPGPLAPPASPPTLRRGVEARRLRHRGQLLYRVNA